MNLTRRQRKMAAPNKHGEHSIDIPCKHCGKILGISDLRPILKTQQLVSINAHLQERDKLYDAARKYRDLSADLRREQEEWAKRGIFYPSLVLALTLLVLVLIARAAVHGDIRCAVTECVVVLEGGER